MLKQAYLHLLAVVFSILTVGFVPKAIANDTVKVVFIKVTAIPKHPQIRKDTTDLTITQPLAKAKTEAPQARKKANPTASEKQQRDTSKPKAELLERKPIKKKQPEEDEQNLQRTDLADRNSYYLASLLLIISGTMIALFFRKGIPLAFAILIIVIGYYILIYALLFLS